jgi:hypothetical protein
VPVFGRSIDYSYLSASMGSRCAARRAGYKPNTRPTETDTRNASRIDLEDALRPALFGEQRSRHDHAEVRRVAVRCVQHAANRLGGRHAIPARRKLQVDPINLVTEAAVVIFEPQHRREKGHVNQIVAVLFRYGDGFALVEEPAASRRQAVEVAPSTPEM